MKSLENTKTPHIILFWSLPSISMLEASKEKCRQLNQAIHKMKPVEIVTNQNKTLQLKKIGVESGRFYGFENFKGTMRKILLNVNSIKAITLL